MPRYRNCRITDIGAERLIAQAFLFLKRGQTDKQTDTRDWTPYPTPAAAAGVGND